MQSTEPYEETTRVEFNKCKHSGVEYINGELRCTCGNAWGGPRIHELYKHLKSSPVYDLE